MNQLLKKVFPFERKSLLQALQMAWPAIIESFFVSFAGLVDSLMVSSLGSNAVAAVGLTTQPKFIGLALFIATGVSVSAIVARRRGEKDQRSANATLITTLLFVMIAALAFSAAFVFFADDIIRWCGSSANTHDYAVTYFKIIMGGMIFNCLQIAINSAQRGAGNTRITMITNVTSNVVNMVMNYLLIGGHFGFPALGIAGAAIATVLGTVVSCIMSIVSLTKTDGFLSIPFILKERIRPTFDAFKKILRFGYSVFLEQILLRVGFTATALMAAKMGDGSMAAHQVCLNIQSLSFAFGDGLQSAAVALIGRSLGEKDVPKAKNYGRICQTIGSFISVILAVIFLFGAEWCMKLFFEEPEIVDIGVQISWVIIVIVIFQIPQVVYFGCLRGAGDTLYTAIVTTLSVSILRTAVSWFCAFILNWGIVGVWMGILADQICRLTLTFIRFRSGKWSKIKI